MSHTIMGNKELQEQPRPGPGQPQQGASARLTGIEFQPCPPSFGEPQRLEGSEEMSKRFNVCQPHQQQPQKRPMPQQAQHPLEMQEQVVGQKRSRGSGSPPSQQKQQQHQVATKPTGTVDLDVLLSHLSAEERQMIDSVMARAQCIE